MEKIQETQLIYGHYNPDANWHFIEWEKRKYTAFNRHFYTTLLDVNDPNALTIFLADEKGGILKQESHNWDLHNGDEVVVHVSDGAMHWWTGPIERRGTDPSEILGHEKSWLGNFGDVVNFTAGTPHTMDPKSMLPEDGRLFVLYNPARGSSYPMPDEIEESYWIHPTTYAFGEDIGYIKYFDYKIWRVTFFDFKEGFLPKEPKALAKFDFDTYVWFVDGKFEFWFDPKNIIEKISAYAWDGMFIPAGLPFYGKDLGDVRGVVVTRHDENPDNKLEIEDWKKILLGE